MQVLVGLIAVAVIANIPSATPAEISQPTGKWAVDYGETACIISRRFGDPNKPVLLAIRPSLNDSTVRIMLALGAGGTDAEHFLLNVSGVKTTGLRFYSRKNKQRIVWIDVERAQFERIAAGQTIAFDGNNLRFELSLAGTMAAVRAMRVCNTDLRAHWNADEAGKARIATTAKPIVRPEKLISNDDYPSQALSESRGGRTRVALLVDEKGAAKDCIVEEHSGVATIDAQTCIVVLKRAKFEPALDAAGKPVKSFLSYSFKWQIG